MRFIQCDAALWVWCYNVNYAYSVIAYAKGVCANYREFKAGWATMIAWPDLSDMANWIAVMRAFDRDMDLYSFGDGTFACANQEVLAGEKRLHRQGVASAAGPWDATKVRVRTREIEVAGEATKWYTLNVPMPQHAVEVFPPDASDAAGSKLVAPDLSVLW